MVQEVQQQGNWYQTPNEIQGIGEIRRRVKEHTQVTPSFIYRCVASGSVTIQFSAHETKEEKGTVSSITSSYGNTVFKIANSGLQIPLVGSYQIELRGKGGTSAAPFTHYIRVDGKNITQITSTSSVDRVSGTQIVNLGRGNILEYYCKVANSTEGGAIRTGNINITITKL